MEVFNLIFEVEGQEILQYWSLLGLDSIFNILPWLEKFIFKELSLIGRVLLLHGFFEHLEYDFSGGLLLNWLVEEIVKLSLKKKSEKLEVFF